MTVYFAHDAGIGRVKIGYVDGDVAAALRRVKLINRRFKSSATLAATTEGRRWVELWFHRRHDAVARGEEWFDASPLLLDDIAALAAGHPIDGQPLPSTMAPHYRHHRHYVEWRADDVKRVGFTIPRWRSHLRRLRAA